MKSIVPLCLLAALTAPSQAETYVSRYKTIIPHVVYGAGWRNRFIVANYNSFAVSVQLRFYSNNGTPMSLPIQSYGVSSVVDVVVQANQTATLETLEETGTVLYQGYATAFFSCSSPPCEDVSVYGVFSTTETPGYPVFEATIPASDYRTDQAVLPFDNRNGFITGLAVTAHVCTASTHDFRLRVVLDGSILLAKEPLDPAVVSTYPFQMSCPGHTSFALQSIAPLTAGQSGVVIVEDGDGHARLSAVGLLFNPKGGAHTAIPAGERIGAPVIM